MVPVGYNIAMEILKYILLPITLPFVFVWFLFTGKKLLQDLDNLESYVNY